MDNYVNITHSRDLSDVKEKKIYRFFEIFPGVLSLMTLFLAFFLSWILPSLVAFFIIIFDIYWLLKVLYFSFAQLSAYRKMKINLSIDWENELNQLGKNWKDIYHLIILPSCKENFNVLKTSFDSLANSKYPKDKMIVVLGIEERAGEESLAVAQRIEKEYGKHFFKFLISVHPNNLEGEIPGKGSNLDYAGNYAKKEIIDFLNIPYDNILLSSFDSDTSVYPQYFLRLTYCFLTEKNRFRLSYQPVPVYNNNIWDTSAFSRIISVSGSFWQMIMQERPEKLVTYSSHSFPFRVFSEVGYPKDIVADDSHIFWKAYFFYKGNYGVKPMHYPVSMDAVMSKGFKKTSINQYKQQRRWAWGCIEIPYVVFNFWKSKTIPLKEKVKHIFTLIDGFWSWACSALLIFFLGWLPLILGGEKFGTTLLSYNLPRLTGMIMNISMVGIIVSALTGLLLLPPRPKRVSRLRSLSMVFQWVFIPVVLIFFGSIPALDAQIRMLFNKPLGFWVTPKERK